MDTTARTRTIASGVATLAALAWVLSLEVQHIREFQPRCGSICVMLEQSHTYATGGNPWEGPSMHGDQPLCPEGFSSMYTPAFLRLAAPLSGSIPRVCESWPVVQVAAYGWTLLVAASMLPRWRAPLLLLVVLLVRPWFGDAFHADYMTGNVASIEAAGVWTIAALGARSRWWSVAAVAFVLGLQKQVYWILAAMPLLARRHAVALAALAAMFATHAAMWWSDPFATSQWLQQARWHDERGAIHPSLRSLAHDLADRWGVAPAVSDLPWLAVSALVAAVLWRGSRRSPQLVATADGMWLCVLAYLAVTPYLKDYTLVMAVPAVAGALVLGGPAAVVVLVAAQLGLGEAGGYHALAVIWTALVVQAARVRKLGALPPEPAR